MDLCCEVKEHDHPINVFDVRTFKQISFDETIDDHDIKLLNNMTSLNSLILPCQTNKNSTEQECLEDETIERLSLAYEKLSCIPKVILEEFAPSVRILDISNNNFKNLTFLEAFTNLTTLICDHNKITSNTNIPYLPRLELLWLNHCNIAELYPWAKQLQHSCPNLKYLSLMGNPAAPSYLNGGNFSEYLQYRFFLISLFTRLIHLDDHKVTQSERQEAERNYQKPFSIPNYLRFASEKITEMLLPTHNAPFLRPVKNNVI